MSNEFDPNEVKLEGDEDSENMAKGLREDNFVAAKAFVKPPIKADPPAFIEGALTSDQVMQMSKIAEEQARKAIRNAMFDPSMGGQVIDKSKVPITDFSKLTLDDVYNLDVNIEAKPFMSADVLKIELADTNYEARWVNLNPQNLGDKIAKGFTYVVPEDLANNTESIQASRDAAGHYRFNDVVAMKIDKATYFAALRAAHLRAIATTNSAFIRKQSANTANQFMGKTVGNDYANAVNSRKMTFYDPGVEV